MSLGTHSKFERKAKNAQFLCTRNQWVNKVSYSLCLKANDSKPLPKVVRMKKSKMREPHR